MSDTAVSFWENEFSRAPSASDMHDGVVKIVSDAVHFFGSMEGKRVLDLGCGSGGTSILLAKHGAAEVVAVDNSSSSIKMLNQVIASRGIPNIKAVELDAMKLSEIGKFDFVFGSFILHHLEPFSQFCDVLRIALKEGGAAFFHENNAASDLLIWFRRNIVGRFGVPRYGDEDEFPLTRAEVNLLRRHFEVKVEVPEMVFLQLASVYLFKRRFENTTKMLDSLLFKARVGRNYSYRQYLFIQG